MLRGVAGVNVLVAAVVSPGGVCGQLLASADAGRWQLVASDHLLAEFEKALSYPKLRRWVAPEDVSIYVAGARAVATIVPDVPEPWPVVTRDPKDDYLVALARAAAVNVLISGDRDLTDLVDPIPPVVKPAAFLVMLEEAQ